MTAVSQNTAENVVPVSTGKAPDRTEIATFEYHDHNSDWVTKVDSVIDKTRDVAATPSVPLGEFFRRPVQIFSHTWTNGANPGNEAMVINPWTLYFRNAKVKAKIQSFAQLRCKLNIKIVVNGNGFIYGCMAVYYHPMTWRDVNAAYGALTVVTGKDYHTMPFAERDFVRHSQKPHGFLIPAESLGCSFELPFLWDKNWVDTTDEEIGYLGNLVFYPLNGLSFMSSNQAPSIDFSVFAWCEDMELSLVTDKTINVAPNLNPWPSAANTPFTPTPPPPVAKSQAGYEDEYGEGPVSKTANSCALVAHNLEKVPVIGPYASATAAVFGGLGKLASLFGFSRPAIIKDIVPYKPMYLGNMANLDAGDTSQKLSMDSKQEVTVDPRVVGLSGKDEMTIASIAGRESFWRSLNWVPSYAASKRLAIISVNPMTCRIKNVNTNKHKRRINMTGSCYACVPFGAWRGTMRYRFQIIASQFHRGRLRLVWDPRKISEVGTATKLVNPDNYSKIIDLANCRDFTVDIGWGQDTTFLPQGWQPGGPAWVDGQMWTPHDGDPATLNIENANGLLGIYVLTSLVSNTNDGSTGNNVKINIYTSCPDLEVANPLCNVLNRYCFQEPQFTTSPTVLAAKVAVSQAGFDEGLAQDHAPVTAPVHWTFGPQIKTYDAETQYVFYGDPIVSIRALMKRYTFYTCYPLVGSTNNATATTLNTYVLPDYPIAPGPVTRDERPPSVVNVTNDQTKAKLFGYCFSHNSFLTYFSPAYLCRRGAIRWKYLTQHKEQENIGTNIHSTGCPPICVVTRGSNPVNEFSIKTFTSDSNDNFGALTMKDGRVLFPDGVGGQCVTATQNQPVLEVELPFYNYLRFAATQTYVNQPAKTNGNTTQLVNDTPHHVVKVPITGPQAEHSRLMAYLAAGDDYSLSMYLGPPAMFYVDYMADINPYLKVKPFTKINTIT